METINVLIVDDELQSRLLIKKLLEIHFPGFVAEEAETIAAAVEKIRRFNPHLIFLDIQIKEETGFDLLDNIGKLNFGVIFTTAYSEFALKAFRYSAIDYLVKPIDTGEFITAVEKAMLRIKNQQSQAGQIEFLKEIRTNRALPNKLTVPTVEGLVFINISDILYCRAEGNYTAFHLTGHAQMLSSYTLGYYSEILLPHNFFRIHRSYLVNIDQIRMYKKGNGGWLTMNNGDEIEVSRNSKESFLKILKLNH